MLVNFSSARLRVKITNLFKHKNYNYYGIDGTKRGAFADLQVGPLQRGTLFGLQLSMSQCDGSQNQGLWLHVIKHQLSRSLVKPTYFWATNGCLNGLLLQRQRLFGSLILSTKCPCCNHFLSQRLFSHNLASFKFIS